MSELGAVSGVGVDQASLQIALRTLQLARVQGQMVATLVEDAVEMAEVVQEDGVGTRLDLAG